MNPLRNLTRSRLCEKLDMRAGELQHLAHTAPDRYREDIIGEGEDKQRRLLVPDRRLKRFQRCFYKRFLRDFPYHGAAYCTPGRGVIKAARVHRKHPYLLHLDIAGFFPSVDFRQVRAAFHRAGVDGDLVNTLTRLVTVDNELPQGAPTSVAVGNLVLYPLDRRIQGQCDRSGAGFAYTRYVDDIAISGGSCLEKFEDSVCGIIEDCGWELNEKGGMLGPQDTHELLGLRVGVEVTVDEQFLADIRACLPSGRGPAGQLADETLATIRGQIAWVRAVQPDQGQALADELEKYLGTMDSAA